MVHTYEELAEVLKLNEDGTITWRKAIGKRTREGDIAGSVVKHRIAIGYEGKLYSAHRVAWLLHYKVWPSGIIDHIDCNPHNNAITNLRDTDHVVNAHNRRKARCDNSTGVIGVTTPKSAPKDKPYKVRINKGNLHLFLGYFKTLAEASDAYLSAKLKLHPSFIV